MEGLMKKLSSQRVFNKVSKHLLKQNKRVLVNGRAEWVGPNGELCASAVLIKPSFRKGLTNEDYWERSRGLLEVSGVDLEEDSGLLVRLTDIHDDCKPSRWPEKLRATAKEYKLKVPEFLKDA
jgi:hypothetical protein